MDDRVFRNSHNSLVKTKSAFTKDERGQLSIFLGIVLIVLMTMLAFVINVGLFVKAKINLQNAVDAAAWSGAATQARQLTNIGYLNWELRNTYKEWMFKYYVIGQRGNIKTHASAITGDRINFRLSTIAGATNYDPFNAPSICLHFGSSRNICGIYAIPGLPRFESVGLPDVSEYFESAINQFVTLKAKACSARSDMNFAAAMIWAFGTKKEIFSDAPMLAAQRPGAWPQAIELGLRVRNLEDIVNRAPVAQPICLDNAGVPCTPVSDLQAEYPNGYPKNERPIKAFMSAFRNLSGGSTKDSSAGDNGDEFASSFTLTELAPAPYIPSPATLSGVLLPGGAQVEKYYLDLLAMPVNLATFFHTFVSNESDSETVGDLGNVDIQATCGVSKTALPVPGYLTGFVKNPEVLTYYAVKGEANYIGLFYPFGDREKGITLKAYAAAKPFGGKIGPMLFAPDPGKQSVRPRMPDGPQARSNNYVSGLNTTGLTFKPGMPIPLGNMTTNPFWVENQFQDIGGAPLAGNVALFSVPNLVYDLRPGDSAPMDPKSIETLLYANNVLQANNSTETLGLYNANQFRYFLENLPASSTGSVVLDANNINEALENVRQPTRYEAANYMIPHFAADAQADSAKMASIPSVEKLQDTPYGNIYYHLFAPLYGPETLYDTPSAITQTIVDYINYSQTAVDNFLSSLEQVATAMKTNINTSGQGNSDRYLDAANTVHTGNLQNEINNCTLPKPKLSIAAKYFQFFKGSGTKCNIEPLPDAIVRFFNDEASANQDYPNFYLSTFKTPTDYDPAQFSTGYIPGPRQLSDTASGEVPRRNFYSTKLIGMGSIDGSKTSLGQQTIYSEARSTGLSFDSVQEYSSPNLVNLLAPGQLSEFGDLKF